MSKSQNLVENIKESPLYELYPKDISKFRYFTTNINVRWDEMDSNSHINYARYMDYFSEARFMALGTDVLTNLKKRSIGPVIYKADIDYINELIHPNAINILTWMDELLGKTRCSISQNIYSITENKIIAKAKFKAIFMDLNKRRPVKLPIELIDRFLIKE